MSGASLYPLREIMIICKGCGGERFVSAQELEQIRSADDLKKFTSVRLAQYACKCGATHCDLRILPSVEGEAALKKEQGR